MKSTTATPKLINRLQRGIPFYELDAIQMLWHGNYVKLLEEGREAFGKQFGLEYLTIYGNGYIVPVVDLHVQYKESARAGDELIIETAYQPERAAKLTFNYTIRRAQDGAVLATATTTQLFVTKDGEFDPSTPDFMIEWRQRWQV